MTNKRIKELNSLRDKSKARREAGQFIVEGLKMFVEAPESDVVETYVTKEFEAAHKDVLKGKKYEVIDSSLMSKLSDTKTPQGVLCVLKQRECKLDKILSEGNMFVVLEDIQDPGNLGTILRTGEGAGVSAVIMSRGCVDIYNPKTIRSTMGSIYRVPFIYTDDLAGTIDSIKAAGVSVYAAHLKGEKYYDEISYDKAAFLIGNEGNGLKEETANLADTYIKIPMEGRVESLNAAVATSVLMYEYSRQRRVAFRSNNICIKVFEL